MIGARSLLASRWGKAAGVVLAGVCALAAAATSHGASKGGVLKVRIGGDQAETRVVVEMDRSAKAKLLPAKDGDEVVLSWPDVTVNADLTGPGKGMVRNWSVDQAGGAARLTLDLTRDAVVARRFLLPPGDGIEVYRYVVDLKAKTPALVAAPKLVAGKPAAKVASANDGVMVKTISAPKSLRTKKVIVIDAGHGGRDPGAHGHAAREKDVTLAAALALKARLEKSGRYKVVLTREKDIQIPLEGRVRAARRADADLFISLHADAGHDPSLRGASVYTLSENGSDRVAKRVLSGAKTFGEVKLAGPDRAVNSILLDLTQRNTRNQSATFAQLLLAEVEDEATLLKTSQRNAGFVVLLAPDVPAVLFEMGFMTNPEDEKALRDPATRRRLMGAVADSIDDYFSQEAKYAAR
ncbi:MAG TPA: N-acetylmuramoyl-L-alanine amidase [Caulobacteraceae bacterium]|jgi:N-acetylmuramoyl-L-alanine amidase